ncbi:MAG: HepT-like ribonuclease domain-containing protein [Thermofilaceae archaeon]
MPSEAAPTVGEAAISTEAGQAATRGIAGAPEKRPDAEGGSTAAERAPAGSVNRTYVERLASDIERSISTILSYTSKPYGEMSEAERYAVRYNLIVAAEALAALAAHLARRLYNEEPATPAHALAILRDRGLLTEPEREHLARLTRLRNPLAHGYWAIDDERIYAGVKSNFESVKNLLKRLREHAV